MITQDCNLSSCAAGGAALAAEPSSGVWSLPVFSGGAESLGPSPGSGYTPNNPSLEFSNSGPASASLAAAFIPNLGAGEHTSINRFVIRGSLSHYDWNIEILSFQFISIWDKSAGIKHRGHSYPITGARLKSWIFKSPATVSIITILHLPWFRASAGLNWWQSRPQIIPHSSQYCPKPHLCDPYRGSTDDASVHDHTSV